MAAERDKCSQPSLAPVLWADLNVRNMAKSHQFCRKWQSSTFRYDVCESERSLYEKSDIICCIGVLVDLPYCDLNFLERGIICCGLESWPRDAMLCPYSFRLAGTLIMRQFSPKGLNAGFICFDGKCGIFEDSATSFLSFSSGVSCQQLKRFFKLRPLYPCWSSNEATRFTCFLWNSFWLCYSDSTVPSSQSSIWMLDDLLVILYSSKLGSVRMVQLVPWPFSKRKNCVREDR
jgi:hypothetical protein